MDWNSRSLTTSWSWTWVRTPAISGSPPGGKGKSYCTRCMGYSGGRIEQIQLRFPLRLSQVDSPVRPGSHRVDHVGLLGVVRAVVHVYHAEYLVSAANRVVGEKSGHLIVVAADTIEPAIGAECQPAETILVQWLAQVVRPLFLRIEPKQISIRSAAVKNAVPRHSPCIHPIVSFSSRDAGKNDAERLEFLRFRREAIQLPALARCEDLAFAIDDQGAPKRLFVLEFFARNRPLSQSPMLGEPALRN